MPLFKYIAKTSVGERVEGTVEAGDKRLALLQLERRGMIPVSVAESHSAGAAAMKAGAGKKGLHFTLGFKRRARLTMRELLLLTGELSDLLASGMKLGHALNTLSHRKTERGQDEIVKALRDDILQGAGLSDALGKWPETFPALYVSLVRAGEASGTLSESLVQLHTHLERVSAAREKVLMALIYPAIIMLMGGGTMIFIVLFVVPRFTAIFSELGSTLPLPTLILIKISSFLSGLGGLIALGGLIFLSVMWLRFIKTEKGRRVWDRMQLRLPMVKGIVAANAYAHFARTLSALLRNGVDVLKALSIVEDTVGNVEIAAAIRDARERVTDGSSISGPLAAGKLFPALLTDMLAVGEQTGDMPGALEHIARRYDSELDRNVKVLTTLLEPILMLTMAILVGFVAISMLIA
ncbi:MAG: type II secretion system F family protein, partial [Kiritimatiellae bacterium]|nr:type II secretion system F family protein [Kiritimatiellia bacterium]